MPVLSPRVRPNHEVNRLVLPLVRVPKMRPRQKEKAKAAKEKGKAAKAKEREEKEAKEAKEEEDLNVGIAGE